MNVEDKKQGWPWWWVLFALTVVLALIVGFVIGAVTPHAITGDDLWRSFITGPPVAGLFAVLAALIAFAACEALIDEGKCSEAEIVMLQSALGLLSREAVQMDAGSEGEDNGRDAAGGDQSE